MQKGEYDSAIADLSTAIKIDPSDSSAYDNRGRAYEAKGEYDLAIFDFSAAIAINSGGAQHHDNRGRAYEAKGEYALAKADFDAADRAREQALVDMNKLLFEQHEPDDAADGDDQSSVN